MRRPTSDVRQRETRRLFGSDSSVGRRRNSSVPFSNVRHDKSRYSQDSETDFLCDRAVEFMDSGDIYSIVAVELAEHSAYFERLLRYHRGRGCIRLPEFLNAGFSALIEYIRRGSTTVDQGNVYEIFIAADYLLVPKLKEQCSAYIKELSNDPSTAINLWVAGRPLHWPEIGEMAFQKILENFENAYLSPEFEQLDSKDVETILMDDSLNCKSEMTVFDAVMRWLAHDPESRASDALSLLWNVRLGMIRTAEVEKMKQNEQLKLVPEYMNILTEWPWSIYDLISKLTDVQKLKLAKPRFPHQVLCVFGGWCDGEGPRAAAQIFNPRANTWTLWTEMGCQTQSPVYEWLDQLSLPEANNKMDVTPANAGAESNTGKGPAVSEAPQPEGKPSPTLPAGLYTCPQRLIGATETNCLIGEIPRRVYAGCVLVGNRVYLVGGFDGTNALKSTLCYDFEVDSGWYEISCMYEKRYYVSVAYASRYIYALGGHNGENQGRLDTAERYNLDENLWQPIASMNRVRSDAAAAELKNRVYVAGGFEGRRYHDSAEYYDTEANQWTLISRMHSPRGGISLAAHGGYIYAIGGNDGNSRLRSIERFDPEQGKWEIVGQMSRRKSNLSSAVLGDDIYIIGGWSDEPEAGILSLVERFDTKTRECSTIRMLTFPASATCACTLGNRQLTTKYVEPVADRNEIAPMAAEDSLPILRSGSPGASLGQLNSTAQTMGTSANNVDYNLNAINRAPFYVEAFTDRPSDYVYTSEMDYTSEHYFGSELEREIDEEDEDEEDDEDDDGRREDEEQQKSRNETEESDLSQTTPQRSSDIGVHVQSPSSTRAAISQRSNHNSVSTSSLARECFVRLSNSLNQSSQRLNVCRRNLRSGRRNRH
ncbi:hypothetical protein SprV_0301266700 [Sparganum proliferum]